MFVGRLVVRMLTEIWQKRRLAESSKELDMKIKRFLRGRFVFQQFGMERAGKRRSYRQKKLEASKESRMNRGECFFRSGGSPRIVGTGVYRCIALLGL